MARASLTLALPLLASHAALAQEDTQTITVTGRSAANIASVAGFGDVPLSRAPFSAAVLNADQLRDAGVRTLGEITRLDASTTDAYNAPGYWSVLAVRGFTLDNRSNYRRDGLPINAETVIPGANKQSLEILKGTSGLQAGVSSPGGLVNLNVKRPTGTVRQATLAWEQDNSLGAMVDLGDRAGADGAFGWRVNAAYDKLAPQLQASQGHRELLAAAVDARLGAGSLLEAEFEASRQTQPSTPGFSLLGSRLPDAAAIDPRINLNNQAWTLPVMMAGATGSLRFTQALGDDWQLVAHAMRQRLDSDDRIAFPYGCSAEGHYDRYCSDGSFDFYDYRSEGEQRTSDALEISASGRLVALGQTHHVTAGLLATHFTARFNRQAFNWVGVGTIDGLSKLPDDPALTGESTNRDERSTELRLLDRVALDANWGLWGGLRLTRLDRQSVSTDGSSATSYQQSFTTPWLALTRAIGAQGLAYLSWGEGVETEVAPNRPLYRNAGQPLPALKSRQAEAGYKHRDAALDWAVAAFDIRRPMWSDTGSCDSDESCTRVVDGWVRHQGLEGEAEWRAGAWGLRGSAMLLRARREDALDSASNGLRPTNVPAASVKLQAAYNVPAVQGLALLGFVTYEGERMVLPDNSMATPGWTRTDLALRYTQRAGSTRLIWRVGVDNLSDQRAWKEAPYQYGHAYLYPLAPRTVRASLEVVL